MKVPDSGLVAREMGDPVRRLAHFGLGM
jgi:hypothetical protein